MSKRRMIRPTMHQKERIHRRACQRAAVTTYNVHGIDALDAQIGALGAGDASDWPQGSAEHDNGTHGAKNGGAEA